MSITVDLNSPGINYAENQGDLILFDSATFFSDGGSLVDTVKITLNSALSAESLAVSALPPGYTSSYDSDTGELIISNGTGDISDANWESALRSVRYSNASDNPPEIREITVIASDTVGTETSDSSTANYTITITIVNDAPTGSATATLAAGTEDIDYTVSTAALLQGFSDAEDDILSVSGLNADHGTVIDNLDDTFTINHDADYNGVVTMSYSVIDGHGGSVAGDQNYTLVAGNNHAPALIAALIDQAVQYGTAGWNYDAGTSFNDEDISDSLSYSAMLANGDPLPAWIQIDAATGLMTGAPGFGDHGTYELIDIAATDAHGSSISAPLTIVVTAFDAGRLLLSTAGNDSLTGTSSGDTAAYVYAAAPVSVSLAISAQQNTGGAGSDTLIDIDNLIGSDYNDNLTGNSQNNVLDGGIGVDSLIGGLGGDSYIIGQAGDIVIEKLGGGTDTVNSSVTYKLPGNVENLTLMGAAGINGTGNALTNIITGNAANNVLNGGAGADTLIGGLGNDTFIVTNGDVVVEYFDEGIDKVNSSITYMLTDNVENLTLTGVTAINGTGNDLANILMGNSAANQLDGGVNADTLKGGAGDDTYMIDNMGDIVTEALSAGIDTINSSVTYKLRANVENLELAGVSAINGTGNGLANLIIGNAANNKLNGATGADTLIGGSGDDIYIIDNAGDIITEYLGEGTDKINSSVSYTLSADVENLTLTGAAAINGTGSDLANTIIGNVANNQLNGGAGNDILNGGAGNNILTGGAGKDYFQFRTADHITAGRMDAITDFNVVDDTIKLDKKVFTVFTNPIPSPIAAEQFVIGSQALDADDFIIYDSGVGALLYDADGNGTDVVAVQFATVGVGLAITQADFHVI